jgi:acetyltransferase-like isoleucine patch superfamily enzyme
MAGTVKQVLKKKIKDILYRPTGAVLGDSSYIYPPSRLPFREHLSVGRNTIIRPDSYLCPLRMYREQQFSSYISIGNNVYIGDHAFFVAIHSITLEDGCVVSENVYITDNAHGLHPERGPIMEQPLESKGPVHIGRNSFIGYRACIMPGVTLGEHCIVGANSVVTRSFPGYSMVAGCPARLIKSYSKSTKSWEPAPSA